MPRPEPTTTTARLPRFSTASRAAHWLNAVGVLLLIATGAVMWGAPGTQWVGQRELVRTTHFVVGVALLVPFVASWLASTTVRDDVRRLARWSADDRDWWRPSRRRRARLGKFNPGQKANAAFTLAALVALLVTGLMLRFPDPLSDDLRTGATAVHDWTALVLGIVVIGHIVMALRDPESLRGMTAGTVDAAWARHERPRWHAELTRPAPDTHPDDDPETDPIASEVGR